MDSQLLLVILISRIFGICWATFTVGCWSQKRGGLAAYSGDFTLNIFSADKCKHMTAEALKNRFSQNLFYF